MNASKDMKSAFPSKAITPGWRARWGLMASASISRKICNLRWVAHWHIRDRRGLRVGGSRWERDRGGEEGKLKTKKEKKHNKPKKRKEKKDLQKKTMT